MEIDDRISGIEIEYHYPECKGRVIRTLRVCVEGELTGDLARGLMKKVNSYFTGSEDLFDHISIVSRARDWTADKAQTRKSAEEFFSHLSRGLVPD